MKTSILFLLSIGCLFAETVQSTVKVDTDDDPAYAVVTPKPVFDGTVTVRVPPIAGVASVVVDGTAGPLPPFTSAFNRNYVSTASTQFELHYPLWPLFTHDGDASCTVRCGGNDGAYKWLQDVRAYEENGTVWLYAKWGFHDAGTCPGIFSTPCFEGGPYIHLFKGSFNSSTSVTFNGSPSILGGFK